ncbi:hypothetical protein [Streptomyces yangpuensis]|uniref:hypothetical protein n=1 Tax=Streptomyces yangpuensis TaxID=1648182 RepID=UPI00371890CE
MIKEIPDPKDPKGEQKLYVTDWFHKHRVDQVRDENPNAVSPTTETNYQYLDAPAWAFDDETEHLSEKARTWSQWRGYGHVRTLVGAAPDKRSQVDTVFFRGMDGDKAPSQPGGKRSVKIKDSEGGEIAEQSALRRPGPRDAVLQGGGRGARIGVPRHSGRGRSHRDAQASGRCRAPRSLGGQPFEGRLAHRAVGQPGPAPYVRGAQLRRTGAGHADDEPW